MKNKRKFISSLEPFKLEQYININGDKLTLFGIWLLEKNNIEPLFENIVMVLFKLFPERFSLVGYPEYPDAKRVRDCLFHCTYKTKGWLVGGSRKGWGGKSGFYLTERGKYILEESREVLTSKKIVSGKTKEKMEIKPNLKQKSIINDIKKSDAYKQYKAKKFDEISEYDLRRALRGTRSTSVDKLKQNYDKLKSYAEDIGAEEFIEFLKFVKEKIFNKIGVM